MPFLIRVGRRSGHGSPELASAPLRSDGSQGGGQPARSFPSLSSRPYRGSCLAALVAVLATPGCNGSNAAVTVSHSAPLLVFSDCRDAVTEPRVGDCLYVEVRANGRTLFVDKVSCDLEICNTSIGYGVGVSGQDGRGTAPVLLRCLPEVDSPVEVISCVPGFAPRSEFITPRRLPEPQFLPVPLWSTESCPPSPGEVRATYERLVVSYPLKRLDGGTCPATPPDAGEDPASFSCPCPP